MERKNQILVPVFLLSQIVYVLMFLYCHYEERVCMSHWYMSIIL